MLYLLSRVDQPCVRKSAGFAANLIAREYSSASRLLSELSEKKSTTEQYEGDNRNEHRFEARRIVQKKIDDNHYIRIVLILVFFVIYRLFDYTKIYGEQYNPEYFNGRELFRPPPPIPVHRSQSARPSEVSSDDKGTQKPQCCCLCAIGVPVKYTDTLIVEQFIANDGSIIPMSITGLCFTQHLHMVEVIEQAKAAGVFNRTERVKKFVQIPNFLLYYSFYSTHRIYRPWLPRKV